MQVCRLTAHVLNTRATSFWCAKGVSIFDMPDTHACQHAWMLSCSDSRTATSVGAAYVSGAHKTSPCVGTSPWASVCLYVMLLMGSALRVRMRSLTYFMRVTR